MFPGSRGATCGICLAVWLAAVPPLFAQGSPATCESPFDAPVPHAVASRPNIAVGDLNGDGAPDMAVVGNANSLVALINTGSGRFTRNVFTTPAAGSAIALADFNDDGALDAVVAHSSSAGVSFFAGNGAGGFAAAVQAAALTGASQIATGDFNNDNHPDFIIGVGFGSSLGLLPVLGNGSGGFSAGTLVTTPAPQGLTVADFDEDGTLDAAIATFTDAQVLLGDGAGGFAAPVAFLSVASPSAIASADFNNDGHVDLLVGSGVSTFPTLATFLGDGHGGFAAPINGFGFGFNHQIAIGDFNGDGNRDIAQVGAFGVAAFLPGDGTGSLGSLSRLPHLYEDFTSVAAADFDGDGHLDFALGGWRSFGPGQVTVLPGDGAGGVTLTTIQTSENAVGAAVADFNHDGRLDIATSAAPSFSPAVTLALHLANGAGGFTLSAQKSLANLRQIVAADFNGDTHPDIAGTITAGTNGPGSVAVLLGNGSGGLGNPTSITIGNQPLELAAGDVDGDLDVDLVVSNLASAFISILLGNGDGTFAAPAELPTSGGTLGLLLKDFTGDGDLDIATTTSAGLVVFPGEGDGTFGAAAAAPIVEITRRIAAADFDGDGLLDVAGTTHIALGNGAGGFTLGGTFPPGAQRSGVAAADFNLDGHADVVVSDLLNNEISLFLGDGAGGVSGQFDYLGGASPDALLAADLDLDGAPDLLAANLNGDNVSIFRAGCLTADLSITKAALANQVPQGGVLSYHVVVRNDGPSNATGVVMSDPLPAGFTLLSAAPAQGSCSGTTMVACQIGTLAAGADVSIVLTGTAPPDPGSIVNTATVAAAQTDPNPGNNSASAPTTIIDGRPPETTILTGPASVTADTTPTFTFVSDEAGSSFQCRVDGGPFSPCASPATFGPLVDGPHQFEVRAIDAAGNVDPSPAVFGWTIDATPPVVSLLRLIPANGFGWNNTSITVRLTCSDAGSGVALLTVSGAAAGTSTSSPLDVTVAAEGAAQSLSGRCDDGASNTSSADLTGLNIDRSAPVVQCGSADGQWHAADVQIGCTADGAISGFADAGDSAFQLQTAVPAGTETADALTGSRVVTDRAGNNATAGPIGGNKVDKKAPTISITSPAAQTYTVGQAVTAAYQCADSGSGLASCAGPVASGGPVDTSTVGARAFVVNAADNVGNTSQSTVAYIVAYGVCVLYDENAVRKSGSTVPIQVRLCDAAGNNLSAPSLILTALRTELVSTAADGPVEDAGNANPDNQFRYAVIQNGPGYIFNLKTTGLAPGTYALVFMVGGDPTLHRTQFKVR